MDFEDFFNRHSPRIRSLSRRLNGRHHYIDANDLYQEALTHIWMRWTNGELEDKTNGYILKSCYFHLKNYLRTHNEYKYAILSLDAPIDEYGTPLGEVVPDRTASKESRLNAALLRNRIEDCAFTPREREAVKLYMEGLTMREIGSRMGITHVRVVNLLAHVRKKLI